MKMTNKQAISFYTVLAIWFISGLFRLYTDHKNLAVQNMTVNGTVQVACENYFNQSAKPAALKD